MYTPTTKKTEKKYIMIPCVIVIRDGVVEENIQCNNSEHAESIFLDKCASNLSNWESNSSSK